MIETVRALIEEPEKLRKSLVFLIKFILSAIFASAIYIHIFGSYELLNFKDNLFWADLYHFFISGKILVVFLIYLTSKFILFELLAEIPSSLLHGFVIITTKDSAPYKESWLIRFLLKNLSVIKIDKKTKRISLGKSYDEFYEILSIYQSAEAKNEIRGFKHSLMNETLHSFFVFAILYFTILHSIHIHGVTVLVVLGLVVSCTSYYFLHVLVNFFDINGADILFGLGFYRLEHLVVEFLKENKLEIVEGHSTQLRKEIKINDKSYSLILYPVKGRIRSDMVKSLATAKNNSLIAGTIFVSDQPMSKTAIKLLEANQELTLILVKNEKQLQKKLAKFFLEE